MSQTLTTYTAPVPVAVPLSQLHPAPWNPRLITDTRFINLCRSIAADPAFMWRRPILAMADGTVYAGNMRDRAVEYLWTNGAPPPPAPKKGEKKKEQINWEAAASAVGILPGTAPAVLEDVPDKLAKERALRDNGGWGEYVDQELSELLVELGEEDSDLTILGFDDDTLKALLADVGIGGDDKAGEDPGAGELPADPITKPGDIWQLGKHKLMCGNSANPEDVHKLIDGAIVTLLVTSPPYAVGKDYESGNLDDWRQLMKDWLSAWSDIAPVYAINLADLKVGPNASEIHTYGELLTYAEAAGKPLIATRIWVKPPAWNMPYYAHSYRTVDDWEFIGLFGYAPYKSRLDDTNDWRFRGVWEFSSVTANDDHPAKFPLELPTRLIRLLSDGDDLIVEPFSGSGTTIIAAEQTGRRAYAMEISAAYCDVAINRWQQMTGQKAEKIETG